MAALLDLYAAHPSWIWAGLGAALLAMEVMAGSGWLLWPAASAGLVAVLVGFLDLPMPLAVLVFALLTMVSTLLARRYLPRSLLRQGHDINDGEARLLGREAKVVAAFQDRSGRVFIDGKEWAAELEGEGVPEVGARVEVTAVAGARLHVRAS